MTRTALFVSTGAVLAMIAVSIYGAQHIPADAMLPIHWNIKGEVDGHAPRNVLLALFPLLGVAVAVIFLLIPYVDPRKENVRRSAGLFYTSWFGLLGLFAWLHFAIIVSAVKGAELDARFVLTPVCVLFVLIGNYLAKSRSTWFIGLRTPWTLSSEAAWIAANRTTGLLFVVTGIAAVAAAYLKDAAAGYFVMFAGLMAAAVIGIAVSYLVWRKEKAQAK